MLPQVEIKHGNVIVVKEINFKDLIFYGPVLNDIELDLWEKLSSGYTYARQDRPQTSPDSPDGKVQRNYSFTREHIPYKKILDTYYNHIPESYHRSLYIIEDHFAFNVNTKLAVYRVGDGFDWHSDNLPTNDKKPGNRVITSITYLNDNFEGGETTFTCGVQIKPIRGYTLIFPSAWMFRHRGEKITKGTKRIAVQHISC